MKTTRNIEAEIREYSRRMAKVAQRYEREGDREWAERTREAAKAVVERMRGR